MADRTVTCCIAGGGPAGMMAGFLLARAGVDVLVLEKHADFLRDFRGDTIHPSTLEVFRQLGLIDRLPGFSTFRMTPRLLLTDRGAYRLMRPHRRPSAPGASSSVRTETLSSALDVDHG